MRIEVTGLHVSLWTAHIRNTHPAAVRYRTGMYLFVKWQTRGVMSVCPLFHIAEERHSVSTFDWTDYAVAQEVGSRQLWGRSATCWRFGAIAHAVRYAVAASWKLLARRSTYDELLLVAGMYSAEDYTGWELCELK